MTRHYIGMEFFENIINVKSKATVCHFHMQRAIFEYKIAAIISFLKLQT